MKDAFGVERDDISKASILKPMAGVTPAGWTPMTSKQVRQAQKAAQQVNAIKPKKARKIMNAAAKEPEGTQIAPGVREYKPAPAEVAQPKPEKKSKSFFERNRNGLIWGGGGAGAGLLAGYAVSGRNG